MARETQNGNFVIQTAFVLTCIIAWLILVFFASQALAFNETPLTRLFDLIGQKNMVTPLHPIGNFESNRDLSLHTANLSYLKTNHQLLEKIRGDLGEKTLRWQLKSLSSRLLYVPENRPEYIELYEAYCLGVINEILDKTQLPNPYAGIITLSGQWRPPHSSKGIYAYIVHNLAAEVRARYEFYNDSKKTVAVELTGQYLSGEVGSYSSFLSFTDEGQMVFTHDRFTIWQNSAHNPYTAFMTPVEETLHIALRKNTETAIKAIIENRKIQSTDEAAKIVDEWIFVEEALVGGLVYSLLPPILEKKIGIRLMDLVSKDIKTKSGFAKYKHLKQGIDLVAQLGYRAAIGLYQKDPVAFQRLL